MTELEKGLMGLYNRIQMMANVQPYNVIDVVLFIPKEKVNINLLSSDRIMMIMRTQELMMKGKDITPSLLLLKLCYNSANQYTSSIYRNIHAGTQPEFNSGTNNIGEGYRKIANTVMLTARASYHAMTGHDLMFHEYLQFLNTHRGTKS